MGEWVSWDPFAQVHRGQRLVCVGPPRWHPFSQAAREAQGQRRAAPSCSGSDPSARGGASAAFACYLPPRPTSSLLTYKTGRTHGRPWGAAFS